MTDDNLEEKLYIDSKQFYDLMDETMEDLEEQMLDLQRQYKTLYNVKEKYRLTKEKYLVYPYLQGTNLGYDIGDKKVIGFRRG